MLDNFVFLSPYILISALVIPVIWLLMRSLPPKPKTHIFPAFFLLKDIDNKASTAEHTPWYMLLLRSLLLLSFILAFADPVLNPVKNVSLPDRGSLMIVVDNDWASSVNWQLRKDRIADFIRLAKRNGNNVVIVPTAEDDKTGQIEILGEITAEEALRDIEVLKPHPWKSNYKEVENKIDDFARNSPVGKVVLFSSGLYVPNDFLKNIDMVVSDKDVNTPYVLKLREKEAKFIDLTLVRLQGGNYAPDVTLLAYDQGNNLLDELTVKFPFASNEYDFKWEMPSEFQNKIARIEVKGISSAASVLLLKNFSDERKVGIISNTKITEDRRDLLSDYYYIKQALENDAKVEIDTIGNLLKEDLSALVLPDSTNLTIEDRTNLKNWVENGGFLIRFAGSNLAANIDDDLLPVKLRYGERSTSGSMTWEHPLKLAPIPNNSPLYGLEVPSDVEITSQVLAEPTTDVFEKTWLQLEDGTPLITASEKSKGNVVLIHTTAGSKWSNFCYSGLFVESLKRMVFMGRGISGYIGSNKLKPMLSLDGFGNLSPVDESSIIKTVESRKSFELSPLNPPGIYGDKFSYEIFNLGDYISKVDDMGDLPLAIEREGYKSTGEVYLKPMLIKLALILLAVETLMTIWVRGIITIAIAFMCLFISSGAAQAQTASVTLEKPVKEHVFDPVNEIYLAYVKTGDSLMDRLSYNGLKGLADVVNTRTAIHITGIVAVKPDSSELVHYPFIYWPITPNQEQISIQASHNLQNYMSEGGIILFDTLDQNLKNSGIEKTVGIEKLRDLTRAIQIPELVKVPNDYILSRSFYLLDQYPGLYAGGTLWVEKEPDAANDRITSVIIGGNNWAAAWSGDASDLARYVVEPDGEAQREEAYKFGVNLLMIALTGNYKSDQIHVSRILERIGK